MKQCILFVFFIPLLLFGQSKKKKLLIAEQQANAALTNNLKSHIQYLADEKLEGRRAGTKGEELAMQYIISQYQLAGLEPKGSDGYIQAFAFDEGKQIDPLSHLTINNKKAQLNTDYFPLSYCALKPVKGTAALSLNEGGSPWFFDVKDWLEDSSMKKININTAIKKAAEKVTKKGATALFLYNSSSLNDSICFDKNDTSAALKIPVIYLTPTGINNFFKDVSASQKIDVNVSISSKKRNVHNVMAFINNNAANTVIVAAHYDHLGYGEDKNALDTLHAVHYGADDNASGTAALIELAKMLKQSPSKNNNYLIANFSGEELNNLGSNYFLSHSSPQINTNYMVALDMVGRYDTTQKLIIGGFRTSPLWSNIFETTTNKTLLLKFTNTAVNVAHNSTVFAKTNTPVLLFSTGAHQDYHKTSDNCDKINYDGERQIVQYVYNLLQTADSKGKLVFAK